MESRGFTLIELLVVIAIIAILAAILFPVFIAARAAAYQITANGALGQISDAVTMYCNDYDDTYMPAMYVDRNGFQAWFGRWVPATLTTSGYWAPSSGLLVPYQKRGLLRDFTAQAKDYLGDHSGFGYNWGFIGSDFHVTGKLKGFPQCKNMATSSMLTAPSSTVVFATSGFYNAPWLANGDGQMYDFGFIDPVGYCNGNPNVDFRHIEPRQVNLAGHSIKFAGNAVVAFADTHIKSMKIGDLKDIYFTRSGAGSGSQLNGSNLPHR